MQGHWHQCAAVKGGRGGNRGGIEASFSVFEFNAIAMDSIADVGSGGDELAGQWRARGLAWEWRKKGGGGNGGGIMEASFSKFDAHT